MWDFSSMSSTEQDRALELRARLAQEVVRAASIRIGTLIVLATLGGVTIISVLAVLQ